MSKIPDSKIQQILSLATGAIYDTAKADSKIFFDGGLKILKAGESPFLDPKETTKLLAKQHKLLSGYPVSSKEMAKSLFSSGDSRNTSSINYNHSPHFKYSISHDIIFSIGDKLFRFSIEDANKQAAATFKKDGNLPEFLIKDIKIKNDAKDIYTSSTNYSIDLSIDFTNFNSLLKPIIAAVNLNNTKEVIGIPLLKILYPFIDAKAVGGDQLTTEMLHMIDPNGLFLFQKIVFFEDPKMKPFLKDFMEQADKDKFRQVTKVFHLSPKKHNFEVFKNKELIGTGFDHTLNISMVSYEADHQQKPFVSKYTPNFSYNLFDTIFIQKYSDKIKNFDGQTNDTKDYVSKLKTLSEELNALNAAFGASNSLDDNQKKTIKQDIDQKTNQLKNMVDKHRVYTEIGILGNLNIYEIKVKASVFNYWEENNFWSSFKKKMLENIGMAGTAASLAVPAAGLLASNPVGWAIGGVAVIYTAISAIQAGNILDVQNKAININKLKNEFKNITVQKADNPYVVLRANTLMTEEKQAARSIEDENVDSKETVTVNKTTEEVRKALQELGGIEAPKTEGSEEEISLKFIFFGDVIGILLDLNTPKNIKIACLNHFIETVTDSVVTYAPINIAYMPISLDSFVRVLDGVLWQMNNNSYYDTESFINNVYENIIKKAAIIDNKQNTVIADSIPMKLVATSTIHETSENKLNSLDVTKIDISKDDVYNNLVKQLIESKDLFNKSQNKVLNKILMYGSEKQIDAYDFFEDFKTKKSESAYASMANDEDLAFEKFINEEYLMPCITLKTTKQFNTILRTKNGNFSRIDNVNLMTANILSGDSLFRLPYKFSGELQAYMNFFVDVGSLIFIKPPKLEGVIDPNLFGIGGLYVVKTATFEYSFQTLTNTFPNESAKLNIEANVLSTGTKKVSPYTQAQKQQDELIKKGQELMYRRFGNTDGGLVEGNEVVDPVTDDLNTLDPLGTD